MFDTVTLVNFNGAVNHWLPTPELRFLVFRGAGACGFAKATYKQIFFPIGPVLLVLITIIIEYSGGHINQN